MATDPAFFATVQRPVAAVLGRGRLGEPLGRANTIITGVAAAATTLSTAAVAVITIIAETSPGRLDFGRYAYVCACLCVRP